MRVAVRHRAGAQGARGVFERRIGFDPDLAPDRRDALIGIAARCPVHLLLERGVDVDVETSPMEADPYGAGG